MDFILNNQEYIQLNTLLKIMNLVESGGQANNEIVSGNVKVNNAIELQKRKKVRKGDNVFFNGKNILVK